MKKVKRVGGKEPGWKRIAVELRRKAWRRWWGRVVRLAAALVVVGLVLGGVRGVVLSRWDGASRVSVVIATPSVYVLSYDPQEEMGIWLVFPDNLMVKATYGYGEYRASALAGLDRQEKKRGKLVEDSVADYLGTFVEGGVINSEFRIQNSGIKARWGSC